MEEIQRQIDEIKEQLKKLTDATQIPFDVGEAFKARVGLLPTRTAVFTKSINESGASAYTVAKTPDGNLQTADGKLIPYYNPT